MLAEFRDGIKGQPLDAERPAADLWLVAAVSILPLYALLEVVL